MKKILIFCLIIISFSLKAQWNQLGSDLDGAAAGDNFGASVSMNSVGNRIAIGAVERNNATDSGYVSVYQLDQALMTWTKLGTDIKGEASGDRSGGSVSFNRLGNRLAIGAGQNMNVGHVRVYEWNGTAWNQMGSDIDGEAIGDLFGESVSLNGSGNVLAVGASFNASNGWRSGHVRVYLWNGSNWVQLGADIDGEARGDRSGYAVSINELGNRVGIGAFYNDGNGSLSGHVRVFEWNSAAWVQLGADIDGEAVGDTFGHSLDLNESGDRLAVGAIFNSGSGFQRGSVRVFEWDSTNWVQLGADIDGEANRNWSGWSVSLNGIGNRLAVGAISNSANGFLAGHTRIYEWDSLAWAQLGADIDGEDSLDRSGNSVFMNSLGNRLIIGAFENDGNGIDAGHARVYELAAVTSLQEVQNKGNFILYPNPTKGELTIETKNSIGEIIQITSITGAVLKEITISQERELIDLSSFENGLYFLKCKNISQKIILIN